MAIFGVLGYFMKKVDVPTAPMVLALILGYTMEPSFRQALQGSQGSLGIFLSNPISVTLLLLAAAAIIPLVTARRGHLDGKDVVPVEDMKAKIRAVLRVLTAEGGR